MKKIVLTVLLSIVSIFSFSNCADSQISKNTNQDEYISYSIIYISKYNKDIDFAEYGGSVFEYDLNTKDKKQGFRFPMTSFYTLGVYDRKKNVVYYAKEKGNDTYKRTKSSDQIYVYDLNKKTDKMITEDLLAINKLILADDTLFFLAAKNDDPNALVIGKIDLNTNKVSYWDEGKTSTTQIMAVDKISKRVYAAIIDYKEDEEAMNFSNKNYEKIKNKEIKIKTPKYTLCSFDFDLKDKKEILTTSDRVISAIYARDDKILYELDERVNFDDVNATVNVKDLKSDKILYTVDEGFPSTGYFSKDSKGVYLINMSSDNEISYYDFETKKYTDIVGSDVGDISDFQVLY